MAEDNKQTQLTQASKEEAWASKKKNGSKLKTAEKPEEGNVVSMARLDSNGGKTDNYMWVEGTGQSRHMESGKKFYVQKDHGKVLISKNAAKETTAPPVPQSKVKKKTEEDDDE